MNKQTLKDKISEIPFTYRIETDVPAPLANAVVVMVINSDIWPQIVPPRKRGKQALKMRDS